MCHWILKRVMPILALGFGILFSVGAHLLLVKEANLYGSRNGIPIICTIKNNGLTADPVGNLERTNYGIP